MLATLTTFAQDATTYTFTSPSTQTTDISGGIFGGAFAFMYLILGLISVVSMWRIFTKAHQPGWAAIVPVYNLYILTKVVGRPWWWLLLLVIPGINIIAAMFLAYDLAKSFGQGAGMAVLIVLVSVIGLPTLAFGPYEYKRPAAAASSV